MVILGKIYSITCQLSTSIFSLFVSFGRNISWIFRLHYQIKTFSFYWILTDKVPASLSAEAASCF